MSAKVESTVLDSSHPPVALTAEVLARLDEALRARPAEDLPSDYARPVYEMLQAHGLDRSDLLALAASLVDLVVADVTLARGGRS